MLLRILLLSCVCVFVYLCHFQLRKCVFCVRRSLVSAFNRNARLILKCNIERKGSAHIMSVCLCVCLHIQSTHISFWHGKGFGVVLHCDGHRMMFASSITTNDTANCRWSGVNRKGQKKHACAYDKCAFSLFLCALADLCAREMCARHIANFLIMLLTVAIAIVCGRFLRLFELKFEFSKPMNYHANSEQTVIKCSCSISNVIMFNKSHSLSLSLVACLFSLHSMPPHLVIIPAAMMVRSFWPRLHVFQYAFAASVLTLI